MPGEEEKVADSTTKKNAKKPAASPRKKPRRDANAPKAPMSGYVRFLIKRRIDLQANPRPELATTQEALTFLAREWKSLSADAKQVYESKAEADRLAYRKELEVYKKTDAYKQFQRSIKTKEQKGNDDDETEDVTFGSDNIPIFTFEFLQHNKERESELRRLRGEIVRLEEEEKALNVNIGRLKTACDDAEVELTTQKAYNVGLETHMDSYRKCLLSGFANLPLPGNSEGPTEGTIDEYMNKVHGMIMGAESEHQEFLAKVRDTIRRLKLPIV